MDKNSLKILKTLNKHKNEILRKDDEALYKLYFKDKYDYENYQDIMFNLHSKEFLIGYGADCKLNNISINNIRVNEFFVERRKYYWEKVITPLLTSLIMPIIVSAITTIVATYLINKK
jgi:hypothetical protein